MDLRRAQQWVEKWFLRRVGNQTFGGRLTISGSVMLVEQAATPPDPTSGAEANLYVKGDKLVIQFNNAGTVRYKYLDLTGTGVTWVHTTISP